MSRISCATSFPKLLLRVGCYCLAMLVAMWASVHFFRDTYVANVCLFCLFSLAFELVWNHTGHGGRYWWYLICVAGIFIGGVVLIKGAIQVGGDSPPTKTLKGIN